MTKVYPSNWPKDIEYINTMKYNKKQLPRKDLIHGVKILKLNESHLLKGQYGLFATKEWKKYNILGEYTGDVIKVEGGEYCAFLTEQFCVDAHGCGNELRFINDYRNISDKPNTKLEIVYLDKKPKVLVVIIDDINEGEEFLLNYGEDYWK